MGTGRSGLPRGVKNTTKALYTAWSSQGRAEQDLQIDVDKWTKNVSKESLKALYRYTGSFYMTSNPKLRDKAHNNLSRDEVLNRIEKTESPDFAKWLKNMDKGLDSYKNTTAFIGYRGAGYALLGGSKTYEQLQAMVGKTVHDPGHMSISTVRGREFSGSVLYEVQVPKGTGIGAYVGKLSQHQSEAEFLINRGTIFQIVKVSRQGSRPVVTLRIYGRY